MVQSGRAGPKGLGARQIYAALKGQIAAGVYGPDGPLPSSRLLAAELGVSRTTVTAAYEQLAAEGFIDVRQGARPRVAVAMVAPGRAAWRSGRRALPPTSATAISAARTSRRSQARPRQRRQARYALQHHRAT